MLKKILLVIAAIIVVFIIVVAMQPSEFQVTRSLMMSATPEAVFQQVNDLHKWETWSPWAELDPEMKLTYAGPGSGVGASYSWTGNKEVGEGRMTITESRPNELVRFKLEFFKPMASVCSTDFNFSTNEDQTTVTWTMSGTNGFISKAFCMFMDRDKMVGGDFEKGLAELKKAAQEGASK